MFSCLTFIGAHIKNNFDVSRRSQIARDIMRVIKTKWLIRDLEVAIAKAFNYSAQQLLHSRFSEFGFSIPVDAEQDF